MKVNFRNISGNSLKLLLSTIYVPRDHITVIANYMNKCEG